MSKQKATELVRALNSMDAFIGVSTKGGNPRPYVIINDSESKTGRRFVGRGRVMNAETGEQSYAWIVGNEAQAVGQPVEE